MFKENSRIINKNGVFFDEEDVLLSKYIHNDDIDIKLNIEAQGEALGFVFVPFDEQENALATHNFLIRLTKGKINVFMNRRSSNTLINEKAINLINKRLFVNCVKRGDNISILIDEEEIFKINIPNIDEYKFGIYSSKGNIVYNIDVKTPSPIGWNANMKNTKGGYLKYIKNGFILYNCKESAEIIQDNIPARKGINYLRFDSSVNSDVKPYIFKSEDIRVDDDKKNVANKINNNLYSFFVEKDRELYSLKFKGKNGTIKNISISMNINDDFVPTENEEKIEGSKLIVDTRYIKEIFFQGVIKDVPSNDKYFIVSNFKDIIKNELFLKEEYAYLIIKNKNGYTVNIYNVVGTQENPFDIYKNKTPLLTKEIGYSDTLEIFYSVDAVMSKFAYKTLDGNIVDIIKDKELTIYTENNSIAPIIVMSNNQPLNLAGAYRLNNGRYIFTNTKRETFESARVVYLSKDISKKDDVITIYGVNEEDIIDKNKINSINNIDNIDNFAKKYDTFSEVDVVIDKEKKRIVFEKYKSYDYIVVDYLMDDSYTLNKIKGTNLYKIDISSSKKDIQVVYEHKNYLNYDEGKIIIDEEALDNKYISLELSKEV